MNYSKKIIQVIMLISSMNLFAMNTKYQDVAIHLDTSEESPEDTGFATLNFGLCLCQQSYPIIATSSLLYNVLFIKFKSTQSSDELVEKVNKSINLIPLDLNNWEIYVTKERNFYLMIPNGVKNDGFNLSNLKKLSSKELQQQIDKDTGELLNSIKRSKGINIEELENIFHQGKKEDTSLWNIVMSGHGTYVKSFEELLIKEPFFKGFGIKEKDLSGAKIAGLELNQFRNLIQFFTTKLNVNFLYYFSCYAGGFNRLLPYITKVLSEISIQSKVIKAFKQIQIPDFTIAVGSISDIMATTSSEDSIIKCSKKEELESGLIDIKKFFDLLHVKHEGMSKIIYSTKELQKILTAITSRRSDKSDKYGISSLPLVMFPNTEKFISIPLNDKIFIITDVNIAKYQEIIANVFRKKMNLPQAMPKAINLEDKEAILIHAINVPLTLNIKVQDDKPAPAIISMIPGISLNLINEININVPFSKFFIESFISIESAFNNYFFIRKLNLDNDEFGLNIASKKITINNVLIKLHGNRTIILFMDNKNIIYINETDLWTIGLKNKPSITLSDSVEFIKNNDLINSLLNYSLFLDKKETDELIKLAFDEEILSKEDIQFINSQKLKIDEIKAKREKEIKGKLEEINKLLNVEHELSKNLGDITVIFLLYNQISKKLLNSANNINLSGATNDQKLQAVRKIVEIYADKIKTINLIKELFNNNEPSIQARIKKEFCMGDFFKEPSFLDFVKQSIPAPLNNIENLDEIDKTMIELYHAKNVEEFFKKNIPDLLSRIKLKI